MLPRKIFLDDLFDSYIDKEAGKMKCDIYEENNAYNLVIDMPGFSKDEIKMECDNGTISISALKNEENNEDEKNYIKRERYYGKISRSFYLGEIDEEAIKAEFRDGTLKIVAPKRDESASKKIINID